MMIIIIIKYIRKLCSNRINMIIIGYRGWVV